MINKSNTIFRTILLIGFGHKMANIHKATIKFKSMINNEPRSPMNLDINATNSTTMEKIIVSQSLDFSSRNHKQEE